MKINLPEVAAAAAVAPSSHARSLSGFICTLPLPQPPPLPPTVGVPLPPPRSLAPVQPGSEPASQPAAAFVFVTSSVMVMLYEGEDFANADRPPGRVRPPNRLAAAPPVGGRRRSAQWRRYPLAQSAGPAAWPSSRRPPTPPGNIKPVFLLQRGEGERGRERTLFVASRSLVLPGCRRLCRRGHGALVVQLNSMPD